MPSAGFFQKAGLFIIPDFLEPAFIAELIQEMKFAPKEPGIVTDLQGVDRVNEDYRKVLDVFPSKEIRSILKQRLLGLMPELEKHFKVSLAGCEPIQYLIYRPGDFFKPHADGGKSAGKSHEKQQRRVSVVIFLNRESEEPVDGGYGQGRLTFYGLINGPQWEGCGFALNSDPGLLIAFPSEKIHEVTPVSHGERFTAVTWFYAPAEEQSFATAGSGDDSISKDA